MKKYKIRIFVYHASYCNHQKPHHNALKDALYFANLYDSLHQIIIK